MTEWSIVRLVNEKTSAEDILALLRRDAETSQQTLLRAFVTRGSGNARFMGDTAAREHQSGWRLTDPNAPWSKLSDAQLVEVFRLCERPYPEVLFGRHSQTRATVVDKLSARFMGPDRSLAERIAGEQLINTLIVDFSNQLPALDGITYGAFMRIPTRHQITLLKQHRGGSIDLVVRKSLAVKSASLFEAFASDLCKEMTIEKLAETFGATLKILNRKGGEPAAQQIKASFVDIVRARGYEIGTVQIGWNERLNKPQFEVSCGATRYIPTSSVRLGQSDDVRPNDVVVFNPDGNVLVNTEIGTKVVRVVAVVFRVALSDT